LRGRAKEAERALEEACLARFGTLRPEGSTPVIRSDNGLIFQSRRFRAACRDYRLRQEFITPYRPEQNGLVERFSVVLKRSASGCTTSAASPKLASPLPSGANGTTSRVLTSHSAIAARISSARINPNSWIDTGAHNRAVKLPSRQLHRESALHPSTSLARNPRKRAHLAAFTGES
jgi:transposase InsO family protein